MVTMVTETAANPDPRGRAWRTWALSSRRSTHGKAITTAAEADETALMWMGRLVITASLLMGAAQVGGWPVGSFVLMMLTLYLGYVIVYWPAVQTRRVEAGTEAVIAAVQTVLYAAVLVPLW